MSNSRAKDKEKTDQKEEKTTRGNNGKSKTEKTKETEKQVHTKQLEKSSEQK